MDLLCEVWYLYVNFCDMKLRVIFVYSCGYLLEEIGEKLGDYV